MSIKLACQLRPPTTPRKSLTILTGISIRDMVKHELRVASYELLVSN